MKQFSAHAIQPMSCALCCVLALCYHVQLALCCHVQLGISGCDGSAVCGTFILHFRVPPITPMPTRPTILLVHELRCFRPQPGSTSFTPSCVRTATAKDVTCTCVCMPFPALYINFNARPASERVGSHKSGPETFPMRLCIAWHSWLRHLGAS